MKARRSLLLCAAALALLARPAAAQSKPAAGFDQLKSLVGEWHGTSADGRTMHVSYQLVSNGTALLEKLSPQGEAEMVTVYTADGARVAATHYCNANNQPHIRTAPISGPLKQFLFSFVSCTNLASPDTGHMDHLLLTIEDRDHLTQEWTWKEKGKLSTQLFRFTRKS